MKDKITYLIIGILTIFNIMLLVNNNDNLTAKNDAIFDKVLIKGILSVGEGDKKITLKADEESSIIIESKESVILIKATPNNSMIYLTPDLNDGNLSGIGIESEKIGITKSDISLFDFHGKRILSTTGTYGK